MAENMDRELGWDDAIEKDSDFIILKEGDYNFSITGYDRARHPGSAKLPPCNKAVVHVHIDSPEGSATINHNLFLHSKCEKKKKKKGRKDHHELEPGDWSYWPLQNNCPKVYE